MDFQLSEDQLAIRDAINRLCAKFDADYWLRCDNEGHYPEEFVAEVVAGGWLGIAMPEAYGGSGLGITEGTIMMQAIAESGAGLSGASALHLNIFGLNPVVVFGTEEQKQRMLPPLIRGEDKACFGVTEPNAGLDTTQLDTRAEKTANGYVIRGAKHWTSMAQRANKVLLLARTTPKDQCRKRTDGLSLFYTTLDKRYAEVREIPKMGRKAVDSNAVFYDGMPVPKEDLVGEEGRGFHYILHGLNPERILIAGEAVGLGRASQRNWAELEAADLMVYKAATLYDAGQECGSFANAAKYLAAEAGFRACETAVLTHGGMGYAKEYHVERYFREILIPRIAPVSREMILNYIAERELGLPKSY